MNPEQLLQSIYLGDRGCKSVMIDSCNQRVAIQVDVISRRRPSAKTWDFYSDQDIKDGWLVFTDVRSVRFEPSGPLPNDLINDFSVKTLDSSGNQPGYFFELSIGSVDDIKLKCANYYNDAAYLHHQKDAIPPVLSSHPEIWSSLVAIGPPSTTAHDRLHITLLTLGKLQAAVRMERDA